MRKQLWVLIAGVALVGTSLWAQTQDDSPGDTLPQQAATPTPKNELKDNDDEGSFLNDTNPSLPPSLPPSQPTTRSTTQPSTRPTSPTGNSRSRVTSPSTGATSGLPQGQQAAAAPGQRVDPNAAYPAAGYYYVPGKLGARLPGTLPQEPTYPSGTSPYTARPATPNGYAGSWPNVSPPGVAMQGYYDGRTVHQWVPSPEDNAETIELREVLKQLRQGKNDAEKTEAR
ncbi:MAG: hypothetical protein IT423_16040, partial [Pirellulaceae bacterium]|nr:hypothetical protein [Pirellulaceae bacterium]